MKKYTSYFFWILFCIIIFSTLTVASEVTKKIKVNGKETTITETGNIIIDGSEYIKKDTYFKDVTKIDKISIIGNDYYIYETKEITTKEKLSKEIDELNKKIQNIQERIDYFTSIKYDCSLCLWETQNYYWKTEQECIQNCKQYGNLFSEQEIIFLKEQKNSLELLLKEKSEIP